MIVYVENKVLEDPAISDDENFGAITKKFCTFRDGMKTNFAMIYAHCIKKKTFRILVEIFIVFIFLRS